MIAMHLGPLHPVETFLVAGLSLVPFVILAAVITVVSRRDRAAEAANQAVRSERGDEPADGAEEVADGADEGADGTDEGADGTDEGAADHVSHEDTAAPHSVQA